MANLEVTLTYPDQQQDDPSSKFYLRPQPSSDSLRTRLNTLSDPRLVKRAKRRAQDPAQHHSPRLLHLSKKLLQVKPQIVKDQENEVKKITREQLFRGKQLEHARNKPTHTRAPAQSGSDSSRRRKPPMLPSVCLHPKRLGQQQLNLIKDQIQIIKQDINRIYPDIPSPKTDAWFRLESLDSAAATDAFHPTRSHSFSTRIPQQSRLFVEKRVSSLNRKIQSIKYNNSQSSSLHAPPPYTGDNHEYPLPPASTGTGQSYQNLSPTPSFTNSSISLPASHTNHSRHSPPFPQASLDLTNETPSPSSFPENSQWGARHPSINKGKQLAFPGSIQEHDEVLDHDNAFPSTQLIADNNRIQQISPDHPSTSSLPPFRLSIVTRGIVDGPPAPCRSSNDIPFQRDLARPLSPAFALTPISCLDNSIMNFQRKKSPFELLLDNGQPPPIQTARISTSSRNSARILLDRNSLDRETSRSSHSLPQEPMNQFKSPHPFIHQQHLQDTMAPFTNSPLEIETHSCDSIRLWRANLGRPGIDDFKFFTTQESSNEVSLVTDVLIEQQGGLCLFGQENFNERFRTNPWKTMKTIYQYDRPGRPDAEYLPGVSRVEVVQTPHSPSTFPLPTPEWYWVTEFSIDRQSRRVDSNGWEYYDVFSRKWSSRRHGCRTFIRRRWWVRVRAKLRGTEDAQPTQSDLQLPSPIPLKTVCHGNCPASSSGSSFMTLSNMTPSNPVLCVTLMKTGVEESITFNSHDVHGGHSDTIALPEGFSSVKVHWDDSSLVPQNPIFSSQICLSEIFHRVLLTDDQADRSALDDRHRQEVFEVLEKHLALINFKRVSKTFRDLSEPQKIKLWKYWLEPDGSSSKTFIPSKPDLKDIWKIIDCHFEQILEMFRFDAYRIQFLHLVFTSLSRSSKPTSLTSTTTANINLTSERDKKRFRVNNHRKRLVSDDASLHSVGKRTAQHASNNALLTFRAPSFNLDGKEIRVDFWSNFLNIVPEFKNIPNDPNLERHRHHHQMEELIIDQKVILKYKVSVELRTCLSRSSKSQNRTKRSHTFSK